MAKQISSLLKFHYDEELFNNRWQSEIDPTTLVLLESGVMVEDSTIAEMIAGGGNYYTIPFYRDIEGNELNYDGKTDITTDDTEDGTQSGVVYGRAKGWRAVTFVNDFTGADPMGNILARIIKWKSKKVQARLVGILEAVLGSTSSTYTDWANHKTDISSSTSTVTDANKIGLTSLNDCAVKALGDNSDKFTFAVMHSKVANDLANLQVLNFFKYNSNGMELDIRVARSGNLTVLITDEVPTSGSGVTKKYTTYILGTGALLHANAPVEKPSEIARDASKNGGEDYLYTRYRETIHPNGFTFSMSNLPVSPADTDLENSANWSLQMNPKNIAIAKLTTN